MKKCTGCQVDQPEENFNWRVKDVRRNTVCKTCHKAYRRQHYVENRQKYIDKARAWEAKNGGKRFVRHGLTEERYLRLRAKYDGKCWCCKQADAVVVDHDHSCCDKPTSCGDCIRGIICHKCNIGIAQLGDNLAGLKLAVEYLSHKH